MKQAQEGRFGEVLTKADGSGADGKECPLPCKRFDGLCGRIGREWKRPWFIVRVMAWSLGGSLSRFWPQDFTSCRFRLGRLPARRRVGRLVGRQVLRRWRKDRPKIIEDVFLDRGHGSPGESIETAGANPLPGLSRQVGAVRIAAGAENGIDGAGRPVHEVPREKDGQETGAFGLGAGAWIKQAAGADEAEAGAKLVRAFDDGFSDPLKLGELFRRSPAMKCGGNV